MNISSEGRFTAETLAKHATVEFIALLWRLRVLFLGLIFQVVLLSLIMFYCGGPIDGHVHMRRWGKRSIFPQLLH